RSTDPWSAAAGTARASNRSAAGRPASAPARGPRTPAPRGPAPEPAPRFAESSRRQDRAALLAQELRDVPAAEPALARGPGPLPAAKGLEARPRAGRRPARPVGVKHAGLDRSEEAVELAPVAGENAGSEAEGAAVG